MRKFAIFILVLGLIYAVLTYFLSSLIVIVKERRTVDQSIERMQTRFQIDLDSMLQLLPEPATTQFTTSDGIEISGWWLEAEKESSSSDSDSIVVVTETVPSDASYLHQHAYLPADHPEPCAIIMAHGYTDNRSGTFKYAHLFKECGCDLFIYDHRGHGLSSGDFLTGGVLEARDLQEITAWIIAERGLSPKRIGWLGESWGAATVLQAAADYDSVGFVIAESPYQDWRTAITERADRDYGKWLRIFTPGAFAWAKVRSGVSPNAASPIKAAPRIEVPTLIFHSLADAETSPDQSQNVFNALPAATPKALHLLDWGSIHAHNVIDRPREYKELVLEFLEREVAGFCP
ncbi:MAG: alpha/beta fold hydrolase [Bacteroidota bacterium]